MTRPRIVIADPIAEAGTELLAGAGDVVVAAGKPAEEAGRLIATAQILVVRSETKVTDAMMRSAPGLQLVGRAGAGVDNIDLDAATRLGILVINAPSGNTTAAAEHTIAMMLALARNIAPADASIRRGEWNRTRYLGVEVRRKTLGIIGLGRIGLEVAGMAGGLGMNVVAHDPVVGQERADHVGARLVDLSELLDVADIVTLHVPLTDKTRGLIGAREIAAMKPGARVVNVARGGLVDESALGEAIQSGHIGGAALDVFEAEPLPADSILRELSSVVLTPHLGASTEEAQVNVAIDLAQQILVFLEGRTPRSALNSPGAVPSEPARWQPYVSLASKLGSLAGQLSDGRIERVVCAYSAELAEVDAGFLTGEVLTGLFAAFTEERVNPVNAHLVARERGIAVEQRAVVRAGSGPALSVSLEGDRPVTIGGDVVAGVAHLTSINAFPIDVRAEGQFLVVTHTDKPGVLAGVSSLLAAADINIGSVGLGRDRPRGRAVMVMQIDEPVPASILRSIQTEAGADSASLVIL